MDWSLNRSQRCARFPSAQKYAETLHYKMLLAMVAAEGGSEDVFDEVEKLLGGEVTFGTAVPWVY